MSIHIFEELREEFEALESVEQERHLRRYVGAGNIRALLSPYRSRLLYLSMNKGNTYCDLYIRNKLEEKGITNSVGSDTFKELARELRSYFKLKSKEILTESNKNLSDVELLQKV